MAGLLFNPGLDASTTLAVPPDQVSVPITFTATLDSQDEFHVAWDAGARLELWTDMPVPGKAGADEWGALPFERAPREEAPGGAVFPPHAGAGQPAPRRALRLATTLELGAAAEGDVVEFSYTHRMVFPSGEMRLATTLELGAAAEGDVVEFSYTHRMVFPSGEIKWLGQFGKNGALRVERLENRYALSRTTERGADGTLVLTEQDETRVHEVLRLAKDLEWVYWSFGKESGARIYEPGTTVRGEALLCIPRAGSMAPVELQPLVLASSNPCAIFVSAVGVLSIAASVDPDALSLRLTSVDNATFSEDFLAETLGATLKKSVLSPAGDLLLASIGYGPALQISLVPLSGSANATMQLPVGVLRELVGDDKGALMFSETSMAAHYLHPSLSDDDTITIRSDSPSGLECIVAPVYVLDEQSGAGPQIAVLTPHQPNSATLEKSASLTSLPSPPLTPPMPPAVPTSTSVNGRTVRFAPSPSRASLSAASRASLASSNSDSKQRRTRLQSAIAQQDYSRALAQMVVLQLLHLTAWFVKTLFIQIFGPVRAQRLTPYLVERAGVVGARAPQLLPVLDAVGLSPSPSLDTVGDADEDGITMTMTPAPSLDTIANELPTLDSLDTVADELPTLDSLDTVSGHETTPPLPLARPVLRRKLTPKLGPAVFNPPARAARAFEVAPGPVAVAVRGAQEGLRWASVPVVSVTFEMDGAKIGVEQEAVEVGEGVWVVKFEGKKEGGLLRVSLRDGE